MNEQERLDLEKMKEEMQFRYGNQKWGNLDYMRYGYLMGLEEAENRLSVPFEYK